MNSVTPLAAALIGALGAVIGGILTASGQLLIDRGRAKREREGEDRRQARELRLAVRLVTEELAESFSLIEESAKSCRYWVAPRRLPTETWNQYRTDIASAIDSPAEWRYITMAYDAINNLNWIVEHRRRTSGDTTGHQLGFFVNPADDMREVWRAVRTGIETLEETLHVPPPASRLGSGNRYRESVERWLWLHGDGSEFDEESAMFAEQEEDIEREIWMQRGY